MTMTLEFRGTGLKKVFNRRAVFDRLSFSLSQGQTLLVSGRNGSGKTTFVKLLCRVLTPSGGTISLHVNGSRVPEEAWHHEIGLVSPYLQLYEEFSARENLALSLALRGKRPDDARVDGLLTDIGLQARADDPVRTFSSGMKQRVKFAFALIHRPSVMMLDEPMTNLDTDGIAFVRHVMEEQRNHGALVVATNDLSDVDAYETQVDLNAHS